MRYKNNRPVRHGDRFAKFDRRGRIIAIGIVDMDRVRYWSGQVEKIKIPLANVRVNALHLDDVAVLTAIGSEVVAACGG